MNFGIIVVAKMTIMKMLFVFHFFLGIHHIHGQSLVELLKAVEDPLLSVQAIHTYPDTNKCHYVEIIDIQVEGGELFIVESWKSALGTKAKTRFTGRIKANIVTGTWKSTFSSGTWSYNFSLKIGKWNKTKTSFPRWVKPFEVYETLKFSIVSKSNIKDGGFACPK